jgi:hypothetical protein
MVWAINFSRKISKVRPGLWVMLLLPFALIACAGTQKSQLNARLAKAQDLFSQHCKDASEKIYRTIDGVEGIYLLKLRPEMNLGNQFAMDDPYGNDLVGDGYIKGFLHGRMMVASKKDSPSAKFYSYVEAIDSKDGRRYRFKGYWEEPWQRDKSYSKGHMIFSMSKTLAKGDTPRYGVTYDDISTREDRENWIAGSSLKVIDLQTNEVIAERRGYMMDRGQGANSGGRAPWLHATWNACPAFSGTHAAGDQIGQTQRFVKKVLKPLTKQGEETE